MQTMELLDLEGVMAFLGVSRAQVYLAMKRDGFPLPRKVGRRANRWVLHEVEEWFEARPRANVKTEEPVAAA